MVAVLSACFVVADGRLSTPGGQIRVLIGRIWLPVGRSGGGKFGLASLALRATASMR